MVFFIQKGAPDWERPFFCLAAAGGFAVVALILAAAAEQDQQNDDPAQIATAEAVIAIVTHKNTSKN